MVCSTDSQKITRTERRPDGLTATNWKIRSLMSVKETRSCIRKLKFYRWGMTRSNKYLLAFSLICNTTWTTYTYYNLEQSNMAPSAAIFLHHYYNPLKTNYPLSCFEYTISNVENKRIEMNFMKMKKRTERVEFGSRDVIFFVKKQCKKCWSIGMMLMMRSMMMGSFLCVCCWCYRWEWWRLGACCFCHVVVVKEKTRRI